MSRETILTAADWTRIANDQWLPTSELTAKLTRYARRELERQKKAGKLGGRPRKEKGHGQTN